MRFLTFSFTMFFVMCIAVFLHELAHYVTMWYYLKRRPTVSISKSIRIGRLEDYQELNHKQRYLIYAYGVSAGILVVLAYGMFWHIGAFLLMIPYMLACVPDLRNMNRIYKEVYPK